MDPGSVDTEQSLTLEGFDEEDSSPDGDDAGMVFDSLGAGFLPRATSHQRFAGPSARLSRQAPFHYLLSLSIPLKSIDYRC